MELAHKHTKQFLCVFNNYKRRDGAKLYVWKSSGSENPQPLFTDGNT
jgi:hypothetical protein